MDNNIFEESNKRSLNLRTPAQAPGSVSEFSRLKVGLKVLNDANLDLGVLKKFNPRLADKDSVMRAINDGDLNTMRDISNFFASISGIYSRLVKHLANFYRYDWLITPYVSGTVSSDKVISECDKRLFYLDNFKAKKFFGGVAYKVMVDGCYYGYIIHGTDCPSVQELPPKYCRSRMRVRGKPAVEFNMSFFDDYYKDPEMRLRILNLFPSEFKKGYVAYKEGRLPPEVQGDKAGWWLLDPEFAFKFSFYDNDYPPFISVIPHIIDLDAAQDLDRKKMAQQLLKIIIQKMPLDKNGDLVFDVDEAKELHDNAVAMLGKAIGIDVLTTFADVEVADMADRNTTTTVDELAKVERTVYNESGTAQNLFNTDGNIALEKSILDDEASIYNLIQQFEEFLNDLIKVFKNNKKLYFRVEILPTTIYNYKELSKLYKEQMQIGFSKMLPQVALGHSQSSILATAKFENEILDLVNVFVPPMSSNTMNADSLKNRGKSGNKEEKKSGREEKPDDQKSEKTIQNRESMN